MSADGTDPRVFRRSVSGAAPKQGERIELGTGTPDERIAKIERVVVGLTQVVETVAARGVEDRHALLADEAWWTCSRCSKRLGIVDNKQGVLRLRHDGGRFLYAIHPGVGGRVETTCSGCGTANVLDDKR